MLMRLFFFRLLMVILLIAGGFTSAFAADSADLRLDDIDDSYAPVIPEKDSGNEAEKNQNTKKQVKTEPTEEVSCQLCGGSGYREIAGDQIPCPLCRGAGSRDEEIKAPPAPEPSSSPAVHPWEPEDLPPDSAPVNTDDPSSMQQLLENNEKGLQIFPVTLMDTPLAPGTSVQFNTPWGAIPFALRDVYQNLPDRGPGFSAKVPLGWHIQKTRHTILGGMQHRYTSPTGLNRVVIVVFPISEAVDLSTFLSGVHVQLFSSFKLIEAREAALGQRTGIAAYYQGILLMRDAGCHLFLARYKGKGYLTYGLYFDRNSGFEIARVMQSIRIF